MKKILSLIVLSACFIFAALGLVACSETEIYSYVLNEDGTYTFASYGGSDGVVEIASSYRGKPVTTIGGGAFSGKTTLKGVSIPDSVKSIGNNAFENCSGLKSITLPDGITYIGGYAFSGCSGLTAVTIGSGIKEIKVGTFYNSGGLKEINIASSVKSIGDYAFAYCVALEEVDIPDTVENLGNYAFAGCTALTDAAIGSGVKEICNKTFANCKELTAISIGNSVVKIKSRAFDGCERLVAIDLPDGLEKIENHAFANCGTLSSVVMPDSIRIVGQNAFLGCNSLSDSDSVNGYTEDYNGLYLGNENNKYLVLVKTKSNDIIDVDDVVPTTSDVKRFKINENTKVIADFALANCTSLKSIVVPDSVEHIGDNAFSGCSSVSTVTLGKGLKTVGNRLTYNTPVTYNEYDNGVYLGSSDNAYMVLLKVRSIDAETFTVNDKTKIIATEAFVDCNNLTTVKSMKSIRSIGDRAFVYCRALKDIVIPNTVTFVGEDAFLRCNNVEQEKDGLVYVKSLVSKDEEGNAVYENKILVGVAEGKEEKLKEKCVVDDTVISIAANAFPMNSYISDIELPSSVKGISNDVFAYCIGLKSIKVASGNEVYSSQSGILYNKARTAIVATPRRLTGEVILASAVEGIDDAMFAHCTDIAEFSIDGSALYSSKDGILFDKAQPKIIIVPAKISGEVVLPSTLTEINDNAFYDRSGLTKLTVSSGIKSIGSYAFYGCSCEIVWDNPSITEIGKDAFQGYEGEALTVPETVSVIGNRAFGTCVNLNEFVLSDGVKEIGNGAFYACKNLKNVTIGENVTSIGGYVFSGCNALKSVTFNGTKEQWNAIKKSEYWDTTSSLTSVVCSDGTITLK